MSRGRGLEAYEKAVNDLLDALAQAGNPRASEEQRDAARQRAVEASLAARYAALTVHEEESEDIDLWVPPHLRPREVSRDFRLPGLEHETDLDASSGRTFTRDIT